MTVHCPKCQYCARLPLSYNIKQGVYCEGCGKWIDLSHAVLRMQWFHETKADDVVHAEYLYGCESCGKDTSVLIADGVDNCENPRYESMRWGKPQFRSPATIKCVHCGGQAHVRVRFFRSKAEKPKKGCNLCIGNTQADYADVIYNYKGGWFYDY